VDINNKIKPV